MKIGYHWKSPDFNDKITVKDLIAGYQSFLITVGRIDNLNSNIIRLHYFYGPDLWSRFMVPIYGPDSIIENLRDVEVLLCPESEESIHII